MSTENEITTGEFLPGTYKVPDKAKQFMKLKQGDNVLRILSSPLLGYVVFSEDKKPVRKPFSEGDFSQIELKEIKPKIDPETKEAEPSKHFWILLVWDYTENAPKILEITQGSILKPLFGLTQDEDWGDLREFDVNIHKSGSTKNDTEYAVTPKPHKPIKEEIVNCIEDLNAEGLLNLNAIWEGKYPFLAYNY